MRNRKSTVVLGILLVLVMMLGVLATGCIKGVVKQATAAETASVKTSANEEGAEINISGGEVQTITSKISRNGYPEITVKKGIPVKWILQADANDLNGCNNQLIIPTLGIEKKLQTGDNIIEFTPAKDGSIAYSCWMGMITSRINVVSNSDTSAAVDTPAETGSQDPSSVPATSGGSCCAT